MRHHYIRTAVTAITLLLAVTAFAIPAKRVWRTMPLTDGTTISALLVGDENGHWYVDENGKTLAKNSEGKLYYLTAEQSETLKNTRQNVHTRTTTEGLHAVKLLWQKLPMAKRKHSECRQNLLVQRKVL